MENVMLTSILFGLVIGWFSSSALAADCYSDDLMAYVDSRIPSGNQTERRWEKIKAALLEQDGGITLARAEEILANRKARGFNLEHMDEVVAALKCLAAQPDPEPETEVVIVPPQPEPEDPPQPLNSDNPSPQQAVSTRIRGDFKVYWAEGTATNATPYEFNEDDHWEGDIIFSFVAKMDAGARATHYASISKDQWRFCISKSDWAGRNHNDPGPIRVGGFDQRTRLKVAPPMNNLLGDVLCTTSVTTGGVLNDGWRDDSADGSIFHGGADVFSVSYRTKILIRDNNVVQTPFPIHELDWQVRGMPIRHAGGVDMEINGIEVGPDNTPPHEVAAKQELPEMSEVPDRVYWKLIGNEPVWPDFRSAEDVCLGNGSKWQRFKTATLTCGYVRDTRPRWTDRGWYNTGNNTCNQDATKAKLEETNEWLPDHCYQTKMVVDYPLEGLNDSSPTVTASMLPTITEDDVSYLNVRKRSGGWTYSASKPIVQDEVRSGCTDWAQREDYVYLTIQTKLGTDYIELPAGDVQDYDIRDAKVADKCVNSSIVYRGSDVRSECQLSNSYLRNAITRSVWIGGWGRVTKTSHPHVVFEPATTHSSDDVNLCN